MLYWLIKFKIFVVQFKFLNCIQPYGILTVFSPLALSSHEISLQPPKKNCSRKKKWKQVCLMCCHGYMLYRHHNYV